MDRSIHQVIKLVGIRTHVKHNVRFQGQTWRKRLQQDAVRISISCRLLCAQQNALGACTRDACKDTRVRAYLFSRHMVD